MQYKRFLDSRQVERFQGARFFYVLGHSNISRSYMKQTHIQLIPLVYIGRQASRGFQEHLREGKSTLYFHFRFKEEFFLNFLRGLFFQRVDVFFPTNSYKPTFTFMKLYCKGVPYQSSSQRDSSLQANRHPVTLYKGLELLMN